VAEPELVSCPVIEDLDVDAAEGSQLGPARPRVSSESTWWAFLSAVGAGFIASGVADVAVAALWPLLLPPTQPHPEWLFPGAVSAAAGLVAIGAVALRAGGIPALALGIAYQLTFVLLQLSSLAAVCDRLPQPDPSIPCGFAAITAGTWPTWVALAVGVVAARQLLPPPAPGANTLLRAAGAFTFALTIAGIAWQLGQGVLQNGLAAVGWLGPEGSRSLPFQVAISTVFLFVELVAGLLAGSLLLRARSASVVLLALLIGYDAVLGVAQVRSNVDSGVPHVPLELAYLQSTNALRPAAGILGIALGRLLARRSRSDHSSR
jgi:hypothetical protein